MSDALFMLPFYLTAQGTTTHIHRDGGQQAAAAAL